MSDGEAKDRMARKIDELILRHTLEHRSVFEDNEVVVVSRCPSCGYIDEDLHTANIVTEYMMNVLEAGEKVLGTEGT